MHSAHLLLLIYYGWQPQTSNTCAIDYSTSISAEFLGSLSFHSPHLTSNKTADFLHTFGGESTNILGALVTYLILGSLTTHAFVE
ncbi:hypothetical protein P692DRAFT_20838491 [Suillus brevipes Sb2]|nr:hypothetical protein P692DRAFT_20838491 [Suillus brevipes Sb2]